MEETYVLHDILHLGQHHDTERKRLKVYAWPPKMRCQYIISSSSACIVFFIVIFIGLLFIYCGL